ncbi:hypothetical protein [Campylobacter curvus]|uniref:hypothetical protein n=1 Tax=Campylobacter curvus TaxID=200 RepID=UPI00147055A1|nr:hypothetical protein [Campylobacter curvus]
MQGLIVKIDARKMILDFGNISNFARQNNLPKFAIFDLLKKKDKPVYFFHNSQIKQTYDKLRQMGYVIE